MVRERGRRDGGTAAFKRHGQDQTSFWGFSQSPRRSSPSLCPRHILMAAEVGLVPQVTRMRVTRRTHFLCKVMKRKTSGGCDVASGESECHELVSENVVTSRCTEKSMLCNLEDLRPLPLTWRVRQTAERRNVVTGALPGMTLQPRCPASSPVSPASEYLTRW